MVPKVSARLEPTTTKPNPFNIDRPAVKRRFLGVTFFGRVGEVLRTRATRSRYLRHVVSNQVRLALAVDRDVMATIRVRTQMRQRRCMERGRGLATRIHSRPPGRRKGARDKRARAVQCVESEMPAMVKPRRKGERLKLRIRV